jgi:AcrR family transcriptional regulator
MNTDSGEVATPARQRHKQHERREDAERRILESALELVGEKGVAGMTLGEVGERAGYSRGLPAHHYGSKQGLLTALVEHIRVNFRTALSSKGRRKPGLDAVRGAIEVYLDRSAASDQASRALHVMFTEGFVTGGDLAAALEHFNRMSLLYFETHIRLGMRNGEIRPDIDPAAQAVVIIGALRGISAQYLLGSPASSANGVRDALLRTVDIALRLVPAARGSREQRRNSAARRPMSPADSEDPARRK